MMKRGTIFFDIGGPILDEYYFNITLDRMILQSLRENGIQVTTTDMKDAKAKAVQEWAVHYHQRVIELLVEERQPVQDNMVAGLNKIMASARKHFRLRKGAELVLRDLCRRWHLGITSKLPHDVIEAELARFGVLGHFDIFPPKHLRGEKTTATYFRRLMSAARGERVWMVGNLLDVDIAPARKCGIRTVLLRVGSHREQSSDDPTCCAEYEIRRLTQLPAVIQHRDRALDRPRG